MSEPTKAVFLSYARDDGAAARRVADALRAFGVEVWFDMSELRGGDAWDAKIRNQIKSCTLFIPIVSAQTEGRAEGYFRREWKLAVDRTLDMGSGRTFIVPVVIDGTKESAADVPEDFMRYQWTRLPGGEPSPEFIAQVKRLLEAPRKPAPAPAAPGSVAAAPSRAGKLPLVLGAVAVLAISLAVYAFLRPGAKELPPPAAPVAEAKTAPAVTSPAIAEKSIAILPFANLSEDKDANAFFADGVHEDLLTNLSFIRDLHVVSRTSVMQYRNTTKSIGEIARELKVAYVLEGSVRRAGNKVRVTGQLIRAATDEHVWASNYDRDLADVFAIQSELAKSIAAALQAVLSPATTALLERKPTSNPAAYDAYLRAREINYSAQYSDGRDVIALLRRAVELDPDFAAAWATLGYREAFRYFKVEHTPAQLALAEAAVNRAVQLAPDDPAVVTGLGDYYYYGHRDYVRATEQYLRLAQLQPNSPDVFSKLAYIQRRQGRMRDALPNFRRAAELDPRTQIYLSDYIWSLAGCRMYAEAEPLCQQYMQAFPDDLYVPVNFGLVELAARGSLDGLRAFAARPVTPAQRPEHLYSRLFSARAAANWAEAIRLDREQRYFDGDDDTPRFLQDVLAAATFAEAGDQAACQARAAEALVSMNTLLAEQPLNPQLWAALSLAHGLLGHHDDAVRCGAKARELLPESRDALTGVGISGLVASALAYAGEKDRALAEFERLLHVPFGANPILDRGISLGSWKPLRDDPRFQKLINDPRNNAPLF